MDDFNDDFMDDLDDDFSSLGDDLFESEDSDFLADSPPLEEEPDIGVDEFDQLRRKSVRGETMDDDLAADEEFGGGGGTGFSLSNFSPVQRLILAVLVVLDILIIGIGLLVVIGRFGS